jgi:hypothetical protein
LQVDRAISESEGHFIAGFIEGEAHFAITESNGGQSFRCFVSLRLRDDDAALVHWLRQRTAVGRLSPVPARSTSKPQIQWLVQTQADCTVLAELLNRFELRGRRRAELDVWRRAVNVWTSQRAGRVVLGRRLERELRSCRAFRPPGADSRALAPSSKDALAGFLHGLLCAEGSFELGRGHTGVRIHLRADDRPLLEMLARELGVGRVRDHRAYPPAKPSSSWLVTRLADAVALASHLDPALLRGRKAAELDVWLRAVAQRDAARRRGRHASRATMDRLIAELRSAREYRPSEPLVQPSRAEERRAEAVRILRRWASAERGMLSASRYTAVREASWPTRDTIARRFGSWDAALRAAGLEHRLARRVPHPVGGEACRTAHDEAQRQRVLATLRYAINVHGSVPAAMQFFRWRLVNAPATPTQATVYRLFPGGWQAVLDALGEVDPRLLA